MLRGVMNDAPRSGRLEPAITRRFWEGRSSIAGDPRSTALDRNSRATVEREILCYQRWMFRNLDELGCSWRHAADLACGNGDWTLALARRAAQLYAVDFTPGFVAHCEQRLQHAGLGDRVRVEVGDLTRCELPGDLDLAVSGAVCQYLDDDAVVPVLRRIGAALAPGGLLYLRTTIARGREPVDNLTSEYQATYRPLAFYTDALARSGFRVARAAITEQVVPAESVRMALGGLAPWLGWVFTGPYRAGWRLDRMRKATDVWACVARHSADAG